jgi:transposase
MLSAMLYVLRTGVPGRDLPACYGPWQSVYTRFRRWCACGLFTRMLAARPETPGGPGNASSPPAGRHGG